MKKIIFESGSFRLYKDEESKDYVVIYSEIPETRFDFVMNVNNCVLCIGNLECLLFDKKQDSPVNILGQYLFPSILTETNGFKFILNNGYKRFYENGEFLSIYPKEISYRDLVINKEFIIGQINDNQEIVYLRELKKLLMIEGCSFFDEVSWDGSNIHCVSQHSDRTWNVHEKKWCLEYEVKE